MERLIHFVRDGGILVLGLPHLQASADRTAVLSSTDWKFVDEQLIERLCGLRIQGPGITIRSGKALGKNWDFEDPAHGPFRLADISLHGADPAVTIGGKPLIVEKIAWQRPNLHLCCL